jgi:hypothetical protein
MAHGSKNLHRRELRKSGGLGPTMPMIDGGLCAYPARAEETITLTYRDVYPPEEAPGAMIVTCGVRGFYVDSTSNWMYDKKMPGWDSPVVETTITLRTDITSVG